MKKLLFILLTLGLLIPTTYNASPNNHSSSTEFFTKKQKKKKTSKNKKSSRSSSMKNGCTYNGYPLEVGPRGGCYYWAGNSKEYVDRSYCSGCN